MMDQFCSRGFTIAELSLTETWQHQADAIVRNSGDFKTALESPLYLFSCCCFRDLAHSSSAKLQRMVCSKGCCNFVPSWTDRMTKHLLNETAPCVAGKVTHKTIGTDGFRFCRFCVPSFLVPSFLVRSRSSHQAFFILGHLMVNVLL